MNKLIIDSSIIKDNLKGQNLINEWIKEKMDKNMLKYELIYKMTENGSKAEDFHKCCDDKGPTLTIIKTTSHRIFGGFTPLYWKGSFSKEDVSKRTFISSLNLNKKFEI